MKIVVKTLKGSNFEIDVEPVDKIVDVKKKIEASQGRGVYPCELQMLIHQGKVLKDDTTLEENKVADNSFIVIMLNKPKASQGATSTSTTTPAAQALPTNTAAPAPSIPAPAPSQAHAATLTSAPATATAPAASPSPAAVSNEADAYGQAASNLVAGSGLEQTIQYILDMGAGSWDRDTVLRALRAAFNNPERAVEYLYSGIPEQPEIPAVARAPVVGADSPVQVPQPVQPPAAPTGPNANPLDLFPQGLPNVGGNAGAGNLDFLRNSSQFRRLQALVQANPQILQPMLQELAKQNPQIMRLIQDHQDEFLQLINEPVEGAEGNLLGQLAAGLPQTVQVTPEEHEAIERLESLGFDRATVLEVFFACNKNEELAANYLLDHIHEYEE